jgi:hypothetical protein
MRLRAVEDAIDRLSHDRVRHTRLIYDLQTLREELCSAIELAAATRKAEEREAC